MRQIVILSCCRKSDAVIVDQVWSLSLFIDLAHYKLGIIAQPQEYPSYIFSDQTHECQDQP